MKNRHRSAMGANRELRVAQVLAVVFEVGREEFFGQVNFFLRVRGNDKGKSMLRAGNHPADH
ncbi:hypothetical protein D3C84_1249770 [compost metagenome]